MSEQGYLPENWRPDPRTLQRIGDLRPDLNLTEEIEAFKDYWQAESGPRARKRDWNAAFRTWCRRSYNGKPKSATSTSPPSNILFDNIATRYRNGKTG